MISAFLTLAVILFTSIVFVLFFATLIIDVLTEEKQIKQMEKENE